MNYCIVKEKFTVFIFTGFLLLLLTSCYEDMIDLDLTDIQSHIVIEGIVSDRPGFTEVKLSTTSSIFHEDTIEPIGNSRPDWLITCQIARKMGATKAINPTRGKISDVVKELGMVGFDVGLEMSGSSQAFNEMIQNMYNGSKIALLGILPSTTQVPWDEIIFKALHLKGIYGREMFETWYKMEQMVLSGLDISPVITHTFPVDEFHKAFDIMDKGLCGKVILNWE
jgi:hypothetical protein